MSIVASLIEKRSIHQLVRFQVEVSQLALLLKRSQLACKLILTRMNQFWGFFPSNSFLLAIIFSWTHICVNCLSVSLLWRHRLFPIKSSKSFVVCSVKVPVLSSYSAFYIDWRAFSMQCNFTSYGFWVFQPVFLQLSKKTLIPPDNQSNRF